MVLVRSSGGSKFTNVSRALLFVVADVDGDGTVDKVPLFARITSSADEPTSHERCQQAPRLEKEHLTLLTPRSGRTTLALLELAAPPRLREHAP
jgi:hypothetical protein